MSNKKTVEPELNTDLGHILNDYHSSFDIQQAKDWLLSYTHEYERSYYDLVNKTPKTSLIPTYGFLSRIYMRGKKEDSVRERIRKYLESLPPRNEIPEEKEKPIEKKYDVGVFLGILEGKIDDFIYSGVEFDINQEISLNNVPNYSLPEIKKFVEEKKGIDYSSEEYSNIGVRKGNKLNEMLSPKEPERKIVKRKKKKIEPIKLVERTIVNMGIGGFDGVHPVHIIDSKFVLYYHVKKKLLCLIKSKDVSGLSVKGSSFSNYHEGMICKKIKNINKYRDELPNLQKKDIVKYVEGLVEPEGIPFTRLSKDVIILKTFN